MARQTNLILTIFVLGLTLIGWTGHGLGHEIDNKSTDLQTFFSTHFGNNDVHYFDAIWDVLKFQYPELDGIPDDKSSRVYITSDLEASYLTDTHTIEFTVLPILETENHLYVRFRGWGDLFWEAERLEYGIGNVFLRWDHLDRSFEVIEVQGEIHANDFVTASVLQLDDKDAAVVLSGASGAAGRVGDFAVYRYNKGAGYECVWHIANPNVYVVESSTPARVKLTSFGNWDGFPIDDLDYLDMASLFALMRRYEFVYSWDGNANTFVETSQDEIFHELAVVNHFLKALKDKRFEHAVEYVREEFDVQASAFLDNVESLLTGHMIPRFYGAAALAELIGYKPQYSDNLLAVVVIDKPEEREWSIRNDQIEFLAIFELTEEEPLQISSVHFCDPYDLPDEMKHHSLVHPLPTKLFNKLGIQRFAAEHGWGEANNRVKRLVRAENIGDWFEVVSIFRSPAVLYVEAHYWADLRFESPQVAERYYESVVDEERLPFLVSVRSYSKDSLEEDVLKFVLSVGSGQRLDGVFTAEEILEETVFGFTIYQRTFWVDFDTQGLPINWHDVDSMTLHLIRQDRLNRADLIWNFKPQDSK